MEWNGQKQTNKQSILEAEMVIESFPIFLFFLGGGGGGGGTIFGIFGHLKTFISPNRHLLRSAQPIFFVLFLFLLRKKTQTNK